LGRINVLDKHTAELIAAGEVVERPASIVKEMMENSIDAGADTITVEIKNGGVTLIRVTDNGSGIMREDVRNAFKSHATSKIKVGDDLNNIATLGFRGEALASVAAVAKVEMLTRRPEDTEGTHYRIEGGEEILLEESGCPAGTTMIVRDLFYNTPARMKFLKKDVSEANAVAVVVDKIALSHPEVIVRFIRDGELKLLTPGNGDLKSVIYEVFDRDFSTNLIKVDYCYKEMTVSGYISKPTASRASRSLQSFFINGRYVRPRTCSAAIEEAFKGMLMTGKFPACVLFLTMPPNTVDVNVHPAKLEVRFHSEKDVFETVYYGVKQALANLDTTPLAGMKEVRTQTNPYSIKADSTAQVRSLFDMQKEETRPPVAVVPPHAWQRVTVQEKERFNTLLSGGGQRENNAGRISSEKRESSAGRTDLQNYAPIPVVGLERIRSEKTEAAAEPARKPENRTAEASGQEQEKKLFPKRAEAVEDTAAAEKIYGNNTEEPQKEHSLYEKSEVSSESSEEKMKVPASEPVGKIIGELFATYILIEYQDELLLVDKHAAHERYIYENLKQRKDGKDTQILLMPETVSLSREEHLALISGMADVTEAGFEIDDFGGNSVIVRAVPMWMEKADIAEMVGWMANAMIKGQNTSLPDFLDDLYHSIACRAAVKAHDKSTPEELRYITELVTREDIRYCPHGRPVVGTFTRRQIEKMFKRLV